MFGCSLRITARSREIGRKGFVNEAHWPRIALEAGAVLRDLILNEGFALVPGVKIFFSF
jgi:hypothetical protein